MTYETTLAAIRAHHPCLSGWKKLLAHLGKIAADDDPLPILTILDSNGLNDALWALRALPEEHDGAVRLLACDIAERALRFVPDGEDRPRQAIDTARRFARGEATSEEMAAVRVAARAAAEASWEAAARAASWAARAAAATAASGAMSGATSWAASRAANRAAPLATERAEQERLFRAWLDT